LAGELHNEELRDLCSSSRVIRLMEEMGTAYSTYRRKSGTYRVLVGKSKGKRLHEIPTCRCESSIKVSPKGILRDDVN